MIRVAEADTYMHQRSVPDLLSDAGPTWRSVREQKRFEQPLSACPPEGPEALPACSLFQGTKAWLEPRLEPAENSSIHQPEHAQVPSTEAGVRAMGREPIDARRVTARRTRRIAARPAFLLGRSAWGHVNRDRTPREKDSGPSGHHRFIKLLLLNYF